jgi:hypothetical protein
MPWWNRNNLRLIQNNLRAKDAAMDRQALIERLKELSCNVLLLNTGGLMAFYPSALDFHYRSPWLGGGDLTGDMVKLCHDNGIRYMARFDFSKVHESIYAKHPEWAYRSLKGEVINYNGMVHVCINSEYQRNCSLAILEEVTEKYPIDGVFFNMFGYTTRDYSNNYHGICQCGNCKAMFRERYGKDLPRAEDPDDPVFHLYQRFKTETVHEVLDNIHRLIKGKSAEIAISTYTDYKVDIVKKESNTEIHRPLPVWEYSSSENHQSVEGTWDDKLISNVCINATSINYRFQGVHSPHVALRFYEALASGAGLDFCIIGVFDDYPDRKNLPVVKDIFKFHKEHEDYFGNFDAVPDVLLVKPRFNSSTYRISEEYLGIFKMLKESHISFRVVEQFAIKPEHTKDARLILCADPEPADALLDVLEDAAAKRTPLVWTGTAWRDSPSPRFMKLFSIQDAGATGKGRWAYLYNGPKELFTSLRETDWTLFDGPEVPVKGVEGCTYALEKISSGFFGPPEMCGGNEPGGEYALLINDPNKTMLFPFQPGSLYMRYGYDEYRHIIIDSLCNKGWLKPSLSVEAHPMVEVFLNRYQQNKAPALYNIQMINLSGYNGVSFHRPVPVKNIPLTITLSGGDVPREMVSLVSGRKLPFEVKGSELSFSIPLLDVYEMIVIK